MKDLEKAYQFLDEEGIQNKRDCSLKQYTTLHIGGLADLVAEPSSVEQIIRCIQIADMCNLPYYILGNGSNVLAKDEGFRGLVIVLSTNYHAMEVLDETRIRVQSGASLKAVCSYCRDASLSGLEFACGIPGSIGGGVVMNAGAYDGELQNVIEEVQYLDKEGNLHTLQRDDLQFSYRHSYFSDHFGIVTEVICRLKKGNKKQIQERMEELMRLRRLKQPLDAYSAGSTFKRPAGNYASALIRKAELMGYHVGDACVSTKHAGFLINKGKATSKEFLTLIQEVQKAVKAHSGYELECEIKMISSKRE